MNFAVKCNWVEPPSWEHSSMTQAASEQTAETVLDQKL